ncbi:MAG TPA: hypothetical protein VFX91_06140 [Alcanivorax sp.]|nr:hypothetical protein [Alcanivorax sp.]
MDVSRRGLPGFLAMATLSFVLSGCGGDSNNDSSNNPSAGGSDSRTTNSVQKGPFQPGGEVVVTQLDEAGDEIGEEKTTQVGGNGEFTLPETDWIGPSAISVTGTFFDETTGNFSAQPMTLHAVVNLPGEAGANVNLYTHMVAHRTAAIMPEADFDTAREHARGEVRALTGIDGNPIDLDLLRAANNTDESDGANLLLFSAAFLTADLDTAAFEALVSDFANDGTFDDEGLAHWRSIQQAAENNPDLLADAAVALQSQYGTQPPNDGGGEGVAWLLSPCLAAKLMEPRVVCVGDGFSGTANDDSEEFAVFIPPVTGRYTIELFGDASVEDHNTKNCYWTLYGEQDTSASEYGSSAYDGHFCGVEDVTSTLNAGERYYIHPTVTRDNADAPAYFTLSASPNSQGRANRSGAVELDSFPFRGYVGTLIGTTDTSYYRFTAGSGTHTITVGGYSCGGTAHVRVDLYDAPADESSPFRSGYRIANSWKESCSQVIEQSLEAGKDYFLKITNKETYMNTSRPAPGSNDFQINIET